MYPWRRCVNFCCSAAFWDNTMRARQNTNAFLFVKTWIIFVWNKNKAVLIEFLKKQTSWWQLVSCNSSDVFPYVSSLWEQTPTRKSWGQFINLSLTYILHRHCNNYPKLFLHKLLGASHWATIPLINRQALPRQPTTENQWEKRNTGNHKSHMHTNLWVTQM